MRIEWTRELVWSERDTRRRRRHALASNLLFVLFAVGVFLANHAFFKLLFLAQ
jgi:hypothetical protein